jgi:hypothetical protein
MPSIAERAAAIRADLHREIDRAASLLHVQVLLRFRALNSALFLGRDEKRSLGQLRRWHRRTE